MSEDGKSVIVGLNLQNDGESVHVHFHLTNDISRTIGRMSKPMRGNESSEAGGQGKHKGPIPTDASLARYRSPKVNPQPSERRVTLVPSKVNP